MNLNNVSTMTIPEGNVVQIQMGSQIQVIKPYIELDYIESTGTQYINTGFKPKYNTHLVLDLSNVIDIVTGSFLFGVRNTTSTSAPQQFSVFRPTSTVIRSDYFGTIAYANLSDVITRATIDKNANVLTWNGVSVKNTAVNSGECSYPLFLFAFNDVGTASYFASYKLYSCQIYDDNGVLVRDYIPVQMRKTGDVGLWDKVNRQFYGNAGTGEFVAGEIAA